MKSNSHKKLLLIVSLLSLISAISRAHSDMGMLYETGIVKYSVMYGYSAHEVRNKARIIAQLTDSLLRQLNYKDTINLSFRHLYIHQEGRKIHAYNMQYWQKRLFIHVESERYDMQQILQLVEYGIKNEKEIMKNQQDTTIRLGYHEFNTDTGKEEEVTRTIPHLRTQIIDSVLQQPVSSIITHVMTAKINKPLDEGERELYDGSISYYMQNGKFFVFHRFRDYQNNMTSDTIIKVFDHINQFAISGTRALVFDTDTSFYFIGRFNENILSQRHLIPNLKYTYRPFEVKFLQGKLISIAPFSGMEGYTRNMLYRIKDDYLLLDLNDVLDQISGHDTKPDKNAEFSFF
jgi:hypothetical protein